MKLVTHNDLIQVISKSSLFSGVPKREIVDIVGEPRRIYVPKGAFIFKEGDRANQLYLIEDGKIALEMSGDIRHDIPNEGILTTFTKNEFLCFQALIGRYKHSYSARALTTSICIEIDAEELRDNIEDNPRVGMSIYKKAVELLSMRFNIVADTLGYRLAG